MFIPSPARRIIRRMGYFKDKKGLLNRYFRESENWSEHLDNCAQFILTCLKNKNVDELVVLGSGWLLDLPLEILAGEIKTIRLVDITHPPQILRKIRNYSGIECINADITGGYVERFYHQVRNCRKTKTPFVLDTVIAPPALEISSRGFIISLNIFSQLNICLTDYLKSAIMVEEGIIAEIREKIQSDHIKLLKNHRFILITDFEELIINSENQETEIKGLIHADIPSLPFMKEWHWMFDNQGTYNPGQKTILKVRALCSEMPEIQ